MRRPSSPLSGAGLWWARRRLRHRPILWWATVVALALTAGLVAESTLSQARADAERFGPLVPAVVAARDLAPGARLGERNVTVTEWPADLLPADALRAPLDGVVTERVLAGEPLVRSRVSDGTLPAGTRALALPTAPGSLGVRPGDRVDVLATFDPLVAPAGEDPTATVARGATVVAVRPRSITVAVTEAEAPRVAFALSQATLTLALTPPGTVAPDG